MNKISDIYTTEYFTGHEFYRNTYIKLAQMFYDVLKPKSVLEVGCGAGFMLEYFAHLIIPTHGIDGSEATKAVSRVSNMIEIQDLRTPVELHKMWDMVLSIEVAEHIEPQFADNYVSILTRHAENKILMTSAGVGQGGTNHVNCQPKEYWIKKIENAGFKYNKELTDLITNKANDIIISDKCNIGYLVNNFAVYERA